MHLVMLETNGNQRYVFSSPRLKENVGASFLLTRLEPWTTDAAQQLGLPDSAWVSRSSGKVILRAEEGAARTLISAVTERAACEAPGMDVSGVMVPMAGEHVTGKDLSAVHTEAARYALSRPPAAARFPMTPFLEPGADTLLPAAQVHEGAPRSLPSIAARQAAEKARAHLIELAEKHRALKDRAEVLVRTPEQLEAFFSSGSQESEAAKAAVLHLDGNGVGAMVRDLPKHLLALPRDIIRAEISEDLNAGHPDLLRRALLVLNERLTEAMTRAFLEGWEEVARLSDAEAAASSAEDAPEASVVPVVPVILGGDDATVITAGRYALPFAAAFLTAFEEATAQDTLLRALNGGAGLTAGAGVAITDRSFPFHLAYKLAERLASRAKAMGKSLDTPRSTLMHHVLYDSTLLDPEQILSFYSPFKDNSPFDTDSRPGSPLNGPTARPFIVDARTPDLGVGTEQPHHGERWSAMLARAAWFQGIEPAPGADGEVPFPHTRAARIRRALSGAASSPTKDACEEALAPARTEWRAAAREPGLEALTEAIGSERLVLDLLDLADVLPESYLRGAATPATTTATKGEQE